MKNNLIRIMLLTVSMAGCINKKEDYALYGHVRDQAGAIIKDVKVSVPKDELSVTTDEYGYYIMSEEQFDPYYLGTLFSPGNKIEIQAEKPGYNTHMATLEFSEKSKQYDITLTSGAIP